MKRDFQRELRHFDRVWQRVTDSRPGPPPMWPPPPPPPPPPMGPLPRPEGLMPKKNRRCCAQRYCPRR